MRRARSYEKPSRRGLSIIPDQPLLLLGILGFLGVWAVFQSMIINGWAMDVCGINGWSASHPSVVSKCPNFSHHSTIGDILSPTDTWFGDVQTPKRGHLPTFVYGFRFHPKKTPGLLPFPHRQREICCDMRDPYGRHTVTWRSLRWGSVLPQTRENIGEFLGTAKVFLSGSFWIGFRMKRRKLTSEKDIQHYRMNHPTSSNRIQSIYTHLGMGQKPTYYYHI